MITGRFAPTPSGRLHLGNLLCAMLAYLSARSQGGRFLLRIEDLDVPRCPRHLSQQCIDDLQWLGFTWDEEPLWQSQRSDVYQRYLDELQKQDFLTYSAHLQGKSFYDYDYQKPTVFCIGNEGNGLSKELSEKTNCKITIPMMGKVESVNAATASTVLMYEAMRQRKSK